MKTEDFVNALDAIGKIRDVIMENCNSRTGFDPFTVDTVRLELGAITALETARKAIVELRDFLLL